MLSAAGGCELSTTSCVKTAWKKFKELKPVLSSRHLSFKTCGHVYSTCVRSAMLHASETWPVTKPCLQRLQRNDSNDQTDLQYVYSATLIKNNSNICFYLFSILNYKTEINRKHNGQLLYRWPYHWRQLNIDRF